MTGTVPLEGKKILFVEDDAFFSDIISTKLKGVGTIVLVATDGQQAISSLEKDKPDLIILDLMLPGGVDGFAILEKIKANPDTKDIPVVILSNLGRIEDIERGTRLGAFRYLTKANVTTKEIIEGLESALSSMKMK